MEVEAALFCVLKAGKEVCREGKCVGIDLWGSKLFTILSIVILRECVILVMIQIFPF